MVCVLGVTTVRIIISRIYIKICLSPPATRYMASTRDRSLYKFNLFCSEDHIGEILCKSTSNGPLFSLTSLNSPANQYRTFLYRPEYGFEQNVYRREYGLLLKKCPKRKNSAFLSFFRPNHAQTGKAYFWRMHICMTCNPQAVLVNH